jgi:hypothetical protein
MSTSEMARDVGYLPAELAPLIQYTLPALDEHPDCLEATGSITFMTSCIHCRSEQ